MNSIYFIFSNCRATRGASASAARATLPFVNRQSKTAVRHSPLSCLIADLIEIDMATNEVSYERHLDLKPSDRIL